ncbi:MAG: methyltransferase family protein [Planctomycetota bacterium]
MARFGRSDGGWNRPIYSPATHFPEPSTEAPLPASKKPTWRRFIAYAFGAAILLLADPASSPLAPWGFAAGAAIALFGEFWRIWGCGHLRKNQAVISSGPYAYVRNPLYLGTLLNLIGFCVAAGNEIVLYYLLPFGLLVFFVYYIPKKERVESARLRKRFGEEFDVYHDAVPGYLPRLTKWKGTQPAPMSWALVVENSEIPTLLLVLGGLGILALRNFGIIPSLLSGV